MLDTLKREIFFFLSHLPEQMTLLNIINIIKRTHNIIINITIKPFPARCPIFKMFRVEWWNSPLFVFLLMPKMENHLFPRVGNEPTIVASTISRVYTMLKYILKGSHNKFFDFRTFRTLGN